MRTSAFCFALFAISAVECRTCRAEAEPARDVLMEMAERAGAIPGCGYLTTKERDDAIKPRVDAGKLCAVNHALRGKWSPTMCATVADALNETGNPELMLAVCTNESDLNERAHRVTLLKDGSIAHDVGLCGVRCIIEPTFPEGARRCLNGEVLGMSVPMLKDPEANIRAAWAIMSTKKRPGNYNAGTAEKARSYEARVFVLVAAWAGELRIPKRATGAKWARVKELARRIVEVLGKERRS